MSDSALPEGYLNVRFHQDAPGYGPEHFDRLMTIDKVAVAMYGCLYDEITNEERQDLVIAHCLGEEPKRDAPTVFKRRGSPQWLPHSQRRI